MPENQKKSLSLELMNEMDRLISAGNNREVIFYQLALKLRECWEPDNLIEVKIKMPAGLYQELRDNLKHFQTALNDLEKKHLPERVYACLGENAEPIKDIDEALIFGHLLIRGGNETSLEYKRSKLSEPLIAKEVLPGYI